MSLIQDALKKVQTERDIIQNSNVQETHKKPDLKNNEMDNSKKKRYIILGISLALISIISISATFLLIKPVKKVNNNKILNSNLLFKNKTKTSPIIKKTNNNPSIPIESEKKNNRQKVPVNKKIESKNEPQKVKLQENEPENNRQLEKKENVFPVFKQKIQLISNKKKKKLKKKQKHISKFEQLIIKGEILYKNKDYLKAVRYFKDASKIKKTKEIYISIYKCYKNIGNLVLLKAYTEEAITQYKNDAFFNKVLGILSFREKKYRAALPFFETIISQNNKNLEILIYKGLCLFHLKKFEESLLIFNYVLELDKNSIEPYYYIGLIYDNLKNYKTALYYYKTFEKNNGINKNFRHSNWIRQRIGLLERNIR